MRHFLLASSLLLLLAGSSAADEPQPTPSAAPKARLSSVLKEAYALRSQGKLPAAALGLEEVFSRLKAESEHRRPVGLELAQLYLVMGRPKRAIEVYRRLKDVALEVEALLSQADAKSHREALVVARAAKYRLGEARALAKLGKKEEALRALGEAPELAGERGKLLLELRRYADAAQAFKAANDDFGRAKATWPLDRDQAKRFLEDAISRFELTSKHELEPDLAKAKKRLKEAKGVEKTRLRIFYAQCLGQRAQLLRKWSQAAARIGDRDQAVAKAKAALENLRAQRMFLTNRDRDAFGVQAAKVLGVDSAISAATAELERRQAPPK